MGQKPLPVGVDNFEKLITRGYYYVDKTGLIRELLEHRGDVNLFTRPRRFGKTLNMSMLQYFFEDMRTCEGKHIDNSGLFAGLGIMEAGEAYLSHMGKYPVISLTLKSGKQPDFDMAFAMLRYQIAAEFERHKYILLDERLKDQAEKYRIIMQEKAPLEWYYNAVPFLAGCLELYYGRKAVVLVDEYDVPLENAFVKGFYDEMADFMRSFFEAAFKNNPSIEFAVITGCLRISKESIFTGLNNLEVISVLDTKYDEYFGFLDEEVQQICSDYRFMDKYGQIKDWYNGYVFGNANVYNPWSVLLYVKDLTFHADQMPKSYWANTSSNSVVRKLIDLSDESIKAEIEQLIDGGELEKPIHEDITYSEVYSKIDNLWNFMFFTGYFKKVRERIGADDVRYLTLSIPNREVRYIFREKIAAWFEDKIKQRDMSRLHTAFIEKNAGVVEDELNDIMLETISFMDEHESYYHGLVAGLLTGIRGYITKSNREAGKGRCDLFVKPVSRRKEAFIVEFKVARKFADLPGKAKEALAQIEERNYAKELENDNYSRISCYGIAFCKKECVVRLTDDVNKLTL